MATFTEAELIEDEIDLDGGDLDAPVRRNRLRISVDQYHKMIEKGIFDEDSRVELIEGVIVKKMGKNNPHITCTDLIQELFARVLPAGYFGSMGNPLTIKERDSEPEPDAQVFRGSIRDYKKRRRTQRDAALVIEVSDTTYRMDRRRKWVTYAGAGVAVYWIVNLRKNVVEIYTLPAGTGEDARYSQSQVLGPDEEVPLVLDGVEVARLFVRDILP